MTIDEDLGLNSTSFKVVNGILNRKQNCVLNILHKEFESSLWVHGILAASILYELFNAFLDAE